MSLQQPTPSRFVESANLPFARLSGDSLITDRQLTLATERAELKNGLSPDLYSLHSTLAGEQRLYLEQLEISIWWRVLGAGEDAS